MNSDISEGESETAGSASGWRAACDLMGLSHICDSARCRRAHACRGAGDLCLARHAPTVPEQVRECVVKLLALREQNVPFDEAMAELDEEWLACELWLTALRTMPKRVARRVSK
jgi:hypothetical protein